MFLTSILRSVALRSEPLINVPKEITKIKRYPKNSEGFIIDPRKGSRKQCAESKTLSVFNETLRYEIADIEDRDMVADFFTEGFVKLNNLCTATNITFNQLYPLQYEHLVNTLPTGGVFLIFSDDKLVMMYAGYLMKKDEVRKMFPKIPGPKGFEIQEDYAEMIDSQEGPFNTRAISTLLGEFDRQIGKWIPDDHEGVLYCDGGCVHEKYKGIAFMGDEVVTTAKNYAKSMGCNYKCGVCVTVPSIKIYKQHNLLPVAELPYDRFRYNGKRIFKNLNDNCPGAYFCIGKI